MNSTRKGGELEGIKGGAFLRLRFEDSYLETVGRACNLTKSIQQLCKSVRYQPSL